VPPGAASTPSPRARRTRRRPSPPTERRRVGDPVPTGWRRGRPAGRQVVEQSTDLGDRLSDALPARVRLVEVAAPVPVPVQVGGGCAVEVAVVAFAGAASRAGSARECGLKASSTVCTERYESEVKIAARTRRGGARRVRGPGLGPVPTGGRAASRCRCRPRPAVARGDGDPAGSAIVPRAS
jgi:hypothetical protein